jgi:streptomycin 6-kinase
MEWWMLRRLAGCGAVRALSFDAALGALLLERCEPGLSIAMLDDDAMMREGCAAIRAVQAVTANDDDTAPNAFAAVASLRRFWRDAHGPRLVGSAAARAVERAFDIVQQPGRTMVVCHGDTNPGNILSARRERWLLIDPLPVRADAAYDAVSLVWTKRSWLIAQPDPVAIVRRRIALAASQLDASTSRIHAWTLGRLAGMIGQRATWGGWDQGELLATLQLLLAAHGDAPH